MSDLSTQQYVVTYAFNGKRGASVVTEQRVIDAFNDEQAWNIASRGCMRGEHVLFVDHIRSDLDLLTYDSMEVI